VFPSFARSLKDIVSMNAKKEGAYENILKEAQAVLHARSSERDQEFWEILNFVMEVKSIIEKNFEGLDTTNLTAQALWYFIEQKEEERNPSWKRRKHRFYSAPSTAELRNLREDLWLSDVAYLDGKADISDALFDLKSYARRKFNFEDYAKSGFAAKFDILARKGYSDSDTDKEWTLLQSVPSSLPGKPAHFLALKTSSSQNHGIDLALVVRGTKQLNDVWSDALAETVDFHGGKAHAGCVKAGRWLVDRYGDFILKMMDGPFRVKVRLIGHSLGAGVAATTAMELRSNPKIEKMLCDGKVSIDVVGFGCPAIVSNEIASKSEEFVITVINDDDVIPRTSIAALRNFVFDVSAFDWTNRAEEDIQDALVALRARSPSALSKFVDLGSKKIAQEVCSKIAESRRLMGAENQRISPVLYPPGRCLHLYRNGWQTYNCAWTPFSSFDEIPPSMSLLDDHLVRSYDNGFSHLVK